MSAIRIGVGMQSIGGMLPFLGNANIRKVFEMYKSLAALSVFRRTEYICVCLATARVFRKTCSFKSENGRQEGAV